MEIEKILKRSEVFLGLEDSDLAKIAALPSSRALDFQPGETIFQAGRKAEYLYVIKEGQIDLVMEAPSLKQVTKVVIDTVTTGEPRTSTRSGNTHTWALRASSINRLCSKFMLASLPDTLRQTSATLTELSARIYNFVTLRTDYFLSYTHNTAT